MDSYSSRVECVNKTRLVMAHAAVMAMQIRIPGVSRTMYARMTRSPKTT